MLTHAENYLFNELGKLKRNVGVRTDEVNRRVERCSEKNDFVQDLYFGHSPFM